MFCWKFDNYEKQQMTLFEKCNLANIPKKTNDVDIQCVGNKVTDKEELIISSKI